MKRLISFATASVIAVFLVVPAMVSAGNDGQHDSAVGGFRGVGGVNNVDVSAHSDANGANPYGHLNQTITESKGTARKDRFDVTCLEVQGNFAKIGLTASDATTAANFPRARAVGQGQRDSGRRADRRYLRVLQRHQRLHAPLHTRQQPPSEREHPGPRRAVGANARTVRSRKEGGGPPARCPLWTVDAYSRLFAHPARAHEARAANEDGWAFNASPWAGAREG